MRKYELMIVTVPDLGVDGIDDIKQKVSEVLTTESGSMESFEVWKEKYRMAYPMRTRGAEKHTYDDATYLLCYFNLAPNKLGSLKYMFDLDERILRFMNINKGEVDGNA